MLDNPIDPEASVLITKRQIVNRINREYGKRFTMGYLLASVGKRYMDDPDFVTNYTVIGDYTDDIISRPDEGQDEYARFLRDNPRAHSMGGAVYESRRFQRVLNLWQSKLGKSVRSVRNINELKQSPFRLLGIANRMDLAGDRDPRNNNEITFEPRSLEELHLLYGLVDPDFESSNGRAFPMVFVVSYRIPSLRFEGGDYRPLPETTGHPDCWIDDPSTKSSAWRSQCQGKPRFLRALDQDETRWKNKMQLWAQRFAALSDLRDSRGRVMFNNDFSNAVVNILDDIVKPENFLSLKSNTKIRDDEYELREWYTLTGNRRYRLIPRKLRREPFRCMQTSTELAAIVDKYWVRGGTPGVPSYLEQDLDMSSRDYSLGNSVAIQEDKAGYEVLRDVERNFLSTKYRTKSNGVRIWASRACGDTVGKMPFRMKQDNQLRDLITLTNIGRVKGDGAIWQLPRVSGSAEVKEKRRHAFAIRSCTGCHSQEGSTTGFHISNRLQNGESKLSPFLIGNSTSLSDRRMESRLVPNRITNRFTYGRANYEYNVLARREEFMHKVLRQQARMYENLMRPEMNH